MKKRVIFSAAMLLAATGAFAQGNGVGGIVEATPLLRLQYSWYQHGHFLFRSRNQTDLCNRGRGRLDRRGQGLFKILVRRPRHLEDGGQLVRGVYFPDCGSDHLTLILPVIWRSILSTRESAAVLSSKD